MPVRGERLAAALVAAVAWLGLIIQAAVVVPRVASPFLAAWFLARYFTILTNLLVAIVFTVIAVRGAGRVSPRLLGGVTLSIVLVGAVYGLLLRGTTELEGGDAIADVILHMVTPVLVPLYWLAIVPKGKLRGTDILLWCLYPAGYLVYALGRGSVSGHYAYPFIDVGTLGGPQVAINATLIALAFAVAGMVLVAIDRLMAR